MIINHNLSAMFAQRENKFNNIDVNKNIEKLSSGLRINRAGDDASGLAVSEKMRSQIRASSRLTAMRQTVSHSSRPPKATCRKPATYCSASGNWLSRLPTACTAPKTVCRSRSR
jgi:hypothetical protein